jgi:hypothetical protein
MPGLSKGCFRPFGRNLSGWLVTAEAAEFEMARRLGYQAFPTGRARENLGLWLSRRGEPVPVIRLELRSGRHPSECDPGRGELQWSWGSRVAVPQNSWALPLVHFCFRTSACRN